MADRIQVRIDLEIRIIWKSGASALGVGIDLVDVKAIREGNPGLVTQ